jgi:hypothetical protein
MAGKRFATCPNVSGDRERSEVRSQSIALDRSLQSKKELSAAR